MQVFSVTCFFFWLKNFYFVFAFFLVKDRRKNTDFRLVVLKSKFKNLAHLKKSSFWFLGGFQIPQSLMCDKLNAQSSCILIQTLPFLEKPIDRSSSGNTVVDKTCETESITDKLSVEIKGTDFWVSYHNLMVNKSCFNISSCIAFWQPFPKVIHCNIRKSICLAEEWCAVLTCQFLSY